MLRKQGTGLSVIELIGQRDRRLFARRQRLLGEERRNRLSGQEITIAGDLKDMFMGIEAVGADVYNYGAKILLIRKYLT